MYLGNSEAQDLDYEECRRQNDEATCRAMIYPTPFADTILGKMLGVFGDAGKAAGGAVASSAGGVVGWTTSKKVAAVAGAGILTWLLLL